MGAVLLGAVLDAVVTVAILQVARSSVGMQDAQVLRAVDACTRHQPGTQKPQFQFRSIGTFLKKLSHPASSGKRWVSIATTVGTVN